MDAVTLEILCCDSQTPEIDSAASSTHKTTIYWSACDTELVELLHPKGDK